MGFSPASEVVPCLAYDPETSLIDYLALRGLCWEDHDAVETALRGLEMEPMQTPHAFEVVIDAELLHPAGSVDLIDFVGADLFHFEGWEQHAVDECGFAVAGYPCQVAKDLEEDALETEEGLGFGKA